MTIKQSVLNTFSRVGIDGGLDNTAKTESIANRFSGESADVTPLVFECIDWVYRTSNAYEAGRSKVAISDFDRVRYFVAETDPNAYNTCLD
jgi:hypothetical protein